MYAKEAKNVRLDGFKIAPRFGFSNMAAKPGLPSDDFECLGIGIVTNTSGVTEGISIENRNGTINAYSVNLTTFARTKIQNSGVDVDLEGGNWTVTGWEDVCYLINGDGTKTVYKHTVGDNDNLTLVQDSAYTAPSIDPEATKTLSALGQVAFDTAADTFTFTADNTITSPTKAASGSGFTVSGNANDNGPTNPMGVTVQVEFASTKNLSGSDYIAVTFAKGDQFDDIKHDTYTPQLKIGGVWTNVTDFKEFRKSDSTDMTLVLYIKGMTLTAIQGIRFRPTTTHVAYRDSANRVAFTVSPIYLGGVNLEASANTKRIWADSSEANGIKYGIRFRNLLGTVLSSIYELTLTSDETLGFYPSAYSCPIGGRVYISSVNAPSGSYDRVEILRLTDDATTWKVIATKTATPYTALDSYCEYELSGLSTATSTSGGTAPDPTPVFRTSGIKYSFPFKNSMVWLIGTGISNIQVSRVGDPEELYDSAAAGDYSDTDLTVPAVLTMADNNADLPVWGCQVGHVAVVIGDKSAYTFAGDFPPQLKSCRQIPGSRGIAGKYAGVRFRPKNGQYAAAYADSALNVWVVGGYPQFEGDASVRPYELSESVRGLIKQWLYDSQRAEFSGLNVNQTLVEFDDVTSSLWIILGRRACVYRQGTLNDGWDFYEYQLTVPPGSEEVSYCTDYSSNSLTASSVSPGDAAWSNVGFAFGSDNSYAESASLGFGTSKTTETLRASGFIPDSLIPVSATLDSVSIRIERSKTGDLAVTETTVQPRAGGVSLGANLSTSYALTTSDAIEEFALSTLPTIAQLNAGDFGLDLKYTQETWPTDYNNPSNWSIVVTGSTTDTMNVAATWLGGGTPPSKCFVNITSAVEAYVNADVFDVIHNIAGTATVDNGQGASGTGAVQHYNPPGPTDTRYSQSSTAKTTIPLTAGTGSVNIVRTGSGVITSNSGSNVNVRVDVGYSGSAVFVTPTASVVRVDNVEIKYCLTIEYASDGATTGISFQRTKFIDGLNFAIRNSGQMDVIERYNGSDISGVNRDGGYPMPTAYFITQDMNFDGAYSQIAQAQVHTENSTDAFTLAFSGDGATFVDGEPVAVKDRWVRFPLTLKGVRFNAKLTFDEDLNFISGLAMEYNKKSRGTNGV